MTIRTYLSNSPLSLQPPTPHSRPSSITFFAMQPEASTSHLSPSVPESHSEVPQPPPSNEAPERNLPQTQFYSVEYPGYVQDASVTKAIDNLGGQAKLEQAFRRMAPKTESLIELALHPENPFAHPIPGDVVHTNNLVLKVTKRKRKRREGDAEDAVLGEYKAEIVGVTSKTVRFRSMLGLSFAPEPMLTRGRHGRLSIPSRYE